MAVRLGIPFLPYLLQESSRYIFGVLVSRPRPSKTEPDNCETENHHHDYYDGLDVNVSKIEGLNSGLSPYQNSCAIVLANARIWSGGF